MFVCFLFFVDTFIRISFGVQLYNLEVDDEIHSTLNGCNQRLTPWPDIVRSVMNKNTSFYLDPLQLSDIRQTRHSSKQDLLLFPTIQYFSSVEPRTE